MNGGKNWKNDIPQNRLLQAFSWQTLSKVFDVHCRSVSHHETPSASFPFVFFSSFLYSFSLCVHVSLSSLTIFLSVSRFLFLSRVQYLFSSGIFNRCQLASDTYCCFQQTQNFLSAVDVSKMTFCCRTVYR